MALQDPQKAFYDTRRYFQGKDDPDIPATPAAPDSSIPRSQLIVGALFLAVIGLAFYMFTRLAPLPGSAPTEKAPVTAPAPAAH